MSHVLRLKNATSLGRCLEKVFCVLKEITVGSENVLHNKAVESVLHDKTEESESVQH